MPGRFSLMLAGVLLFFPTCASSASFGCRRRPGLRPSAAFRHGCGQQRRGPPRRQPGWRSWGGSLLRHGRGWRLPLTRCRQKAVSMFEFGLVNCGSDSVVKHVMLVAQQVAGCPLSKLGRATCFTALCYRAASCLCSKPSMLPPPGCSCPLPGARWRRRSRAPRSSAASAPQPRQRRGTSEPTWHPRRTRCQPWRR
jgi:hypothetical protein